MDLARQGMPVWNKDDPLEVFYQENKKEVDTLLKTQKLRDYSSLLNPSGLKQLGKKLNVKSWGKGGRYGGALHLGFVVNNKYVIIVYTQPLNRKEAYNDKVGYAMLKSLLRMLAEKHIPEFSQ